MSRGPENNFRASVHKHLPPHIYYEKMANPYRGGTPDDWYSGRKDLWIEWKFIEVPKRDDTMIDPTSAKAKMLSALQLDWLNDRYDEGRNVMVGIGSKTGGILLRDRLWNVPISAKDFRARLLSREELAAEILNFLG